MEILDRNKSEQILLRLFQKLGRTDPKYLKKYFRRYLYFKIFKKPFLFNFSSLPLLWSPQKKGEKTILEAYEDLVELKTYTIDPKDKKYKSIYLYKTILPRLTSFLNKEGIDSIYAVSEFYYGKKGDQLITERNMVMRIKPDEILKTMGLMETERFFFPHDLSWLFGDTHEDFCFLAGKKDFVKRFKMTLKNYQDIFVKRLKNIDEFMHITNVAVLL